MDKAKCLIEAVWLQWDHEYEKTFSRNLIIPDFNVHQTVATSEAQHEDVKAIKPNKLARPAGGQFTSVRRQFKHISVLENRRRADVSALRTIGRWAYAEFSIKTEWNGQRW